MEPRFPDYSAPAFLFPQKGNCLTLCQELTEAFVAWCWGRVSIPGCSLVGAHVGRRCYGLVPVPWGVGWIHLCPGTEGASQWNERTRLSRDPGPQAARTLADARAAGLRALLKRAVWPSSTGSADIGCPPRRRSTVSCASVTRQFSLRLLFVCLKGTQQSPSPH